MMKLCGSFCQHYQKFEYHEPNHLYKNFTDNGQAKNTFIFIAQEAEQNSLVVIKSALKFEYRNGQLILTPLSDFGQQLIQKLNVKKISDKQYTLIIRPIKANTPNISNNPGISGIRQLLTLFKNQSSQLDIQCPIIFNFEFYNNVESIPRPRKDPLECADIIGFIPEIGFITDAKKNQTHLFINGPLSDSKNNSILLQKYVRSLKAIDKTPLFKTAPSNPAPKYTTNVSDHEYADIVEKVKNHILDGDAYQVVISRQFKLACNHPFEAYLTLQHNNISPYHYYYNLGEAIIIGASPETNIKVRFTKERKDEYRELTLYPIAGTQPRGVDSNGNIDPDKDMRQESKLRLDTKEMAEHMMLVDLARNDVSRVAIPGSTTVSNLMQVVKFSKVMHLYSLVTGQLSSDFDELNCFSACMNMGTLSGAPKRKATEILQKFEGQTRGPYGGGIGWISTYDECDTAINIRSALIKNNTAYIQAGAGIVFDSDPMSEALETKQKANAIIQAIAQANCLEVI